MHADRKDGAEFNFLLSIFVADRLLFSDHSKNILHFSTEVESNWGVSTVHAARQFKSCQTNLCH